MKVLMLLFTLTVVLILSTTINADGNKNMTRKQMVAYLEKYGYSEETGDLTNKQLRQAIKKFQKKFHIEETGEMDEATINLADKPRCGMPDIGEFTTWHTKWQTKDITYSIHNYPLSTDNLNVASIDDAIDDAFKIWEGVSQLTFRRVDPSQISIIKIYFTNAETGHGALDPHSFDGPSGVLAHAFYPIDVPSSLLDASVGGDAHFDNSEQWMLDLGSGIDLFLVAVHEFGHSLGIRHSDDTNATMYPYYSRKSLDAFALGTDDIEAIQSLYDAPERATTTPQPTTTTEPTTTTTSITTTATGTTPLPSLSGRREIFCEDPRIDAVLKDGRGNIYLFKDNFHARVKFDKGFLVKKQFPRITSDRLTSSGSQPSTSVDAAVYVKKFLTLVCTFNRKGKLRCRRKFVEGHRIFLFSGDTYHQSNNINFQSARFPISGKIADKFEGVPNDVDSAFSLDPSEIYFTKHVNGEDTIYRVSRQRNGNYTQDAGFPKRLEAEFDFTPPNEATTPPIDGVFYSLDQNTWYIFSGVNYYTVTEDGVDDVMESIRDNWLSC